MELKPVSTDEVESFGLKNDQEFSISSADEGMIFELLRSKMYADPIGSISREVASNSRDANREVGKGTTPIKISIVAPNELFSISDLSISFEDEGPGISPQRMTDVFLKYAASTKRSTNVFTGGFGLGAKTPFAYTDVFHIITVHDKIKYHYLAFIDESRKGKVSQLSVQKTEEANGTKIVVPLQPKDRHRFEQSVIAATTFWDVKPTLKGFTHSYPKFSPVLTTPGDSQLLKYTSSDYDNASFIACIDGIAYRLNTGLLKLNNLSDNTMKIVLKFPNGILNISSNRETLQYDDETIKVLTERIQEVSKMIAENINARIATASNNFTALVIHNNIKGGSDDLHKQYQVFQNINKTHSLNFNYKGMNLPSMSSLQFNDLAFNVYNSHSFAQVKVKPQPYNWNNNVVLSNPIYYVEGKLDSRRIETLRTTHSTFTLITLPKIKFSRYENDKSPARLAAKEKAQKDMADKFLTLGPVLKFEDVERAELDKKAVKAKPLYTQIPVRAFVGSKVDAPEASSWGSQSLKYDKNNDKFVFEKYPQVIYIPVASLNEITAEDNKKGLIGQMASFYLNIPIVLVNERYEKNFKTQLTVVEAIAKVPVAKLQATYDYCLVAENAIDQRLTLWDKINFPADIAKALTTLKAYTKTNKYEGAKVKDSSRVLNILKAYKLGPSAEIKDALDNFNSIIVKYPLLNFMNDASSRHSKEFADAIQHYVDKLK